MNSEELLPCPFCGCIPHYEGDAAEWKDESRYVDLSLECCATMTEAIGWHRARDMSVEMRTAELRGRLAKRWNTRYASEQCVTGGEVKP